MEKIDLKKYLPEYIVSGRQNKKYKLHVKADDKYLMCSYLRPSKHAGIREYNYTLPRYISKNNETFEVLGLLQAEMGKTQNGCLTFCNHEYNIIKKVMKWFEKELELGINDWKWYIKVNINEPEEQDYKTKVEKKVVSHWISKINIQKELSYPKKVSYVKNTRNKKLKFSDYGTFIIDYKRNLFSQIIKNYVKRLSYSILDFSNEEIRCFMRGILAGEGCVEINNTYKKFRVQLSANKEEERILYQRCLEKLGIESSLYKDHKDLVISKKNNLVELLKQKLMCLSPKKYNKFLRIKEFYKGFYDLDLWKEENKFGPHNKIPKENINAILELHQENPSWPAWKIAEKVGVSTIKVQRVRTKTK